MSASRLNQSTVERVDASVQTWSVVVAEQEARKARLSEFAGAPAHINIKQAPLFLLFLSDLSRAERLAREVGRPHTGLHFLETFLVSVIDAGLAAQNAVVALESLDLGTVISAQCETRRMKWPAKLGLPTHVAPVFGLCVGCPDPAVASAVKPRLPSSWFIARLTRSVYGTKALLPTMRCCGSFE